jgi:predicted ester cyclase
MMIDWHKMMPDLHLTIEDMIAEGDKVVCRNVWRATYKNGRPFQLKGIVIWRLAAGKLVERWASVDNPAT